MTISNDSPSRIDAALRWVGDLDHPFYDDERQRYVWYEASTIGFQLILMLQLMVAVVAVIVSGSAAMPYVGFALAPTFLAAVIVIAYASKRGADYTPQKSDLRRSRSVFAFILIPLCALAIGRLGTEDGGFVQGDFDLSTIAGFFVGCGVVGAIFGFIASRSRSKSSDDELD